MVASLRRRIPAISTLVLALLAWSLMIVPADAEHRGGPVSSPPAPSQTSTVVTAVPVGVLTVEAGTVWAGAGLAVSGQIVGAGDVIQTYSDSEATAIFFDGSVLQIAPDTLVQLTRLQVPGASDGAITVFQRLGTTWSVVTAFSDSQTRYQVITPAGMGLVRGTEFMTVVMPAGAAKYGVVSGTVEVSSAGWAVVPVNPGTALVVGVPTPAADGTSSAPPPALLEWEPNEVEEHGLLLARQRRADASASAAGPASATDAASTEFLWGDMTPGSAGTAVPHGTA